MGDKMKKNIVLIGFMGTGKTSIGRNVAQKLNMEFVDTDELIEKQTGLTIPEIFSANGEDYFRRLESRIVEQVSKKEKQVIATGGGVVLKEENMKHLREKGFIIHLKSNPDTILRNIGGGDNRPLLKDNPTKEKIIEMLEKRKEYYKNHDYEIDVSVLTVEEAAEKIIDIYCR